MPRLCQLSVATLALIGTLALAACSTVPPVRTGGPYPPVEAQCDAERARWAIGREATADVVEEVRVATGSRDVRVIHPGQAVTMDYSPVRVNIHVNERDAITSITCG
ncbi:MAG TPA: I78 family peptidase inhibitor [Xanthomonadaceae bacterium]|nr:I78 family peptidase inhibitor [Xanthomonadaceae bacterium]